MSGAPAENRPVPGGWPAATDAVAGSGQRPVVLYRHEPAGADRDRLPRVLLLHGLASGASVWDPLCQRLRDRARLCVADLPWRGEGVPGWAYYPDATVWLAQALDEAGGADVVVAHSSTAGLLLDLLTRGPGDEPVRRYGIRGLVLVAPFYRPRPEDFTWDSLPGMLEKFTAIMADGIRVAGAGRIKPELHQAMAQRLCEAIGPYGWTRLYDLYLRTPWMDLRRTAVPTLVVRGSADPTAPAADSEALAKALPDGRLHPIVDCGHQPMTERADEFAGLLGEFLDRYRDVGAKS